MIGPTLRKDPEANRMFLDILTSRNSPEVVLRLMNEAGVLGRFIPEFGRIVAMMQFNMYHHYTVDEHLLRSVGVLSDIEAGRLGGDHPLAHKIVGTIRNRRALYAGDCSCTTSPKAGRRIIPLAGAVIGAKARASGSA